MYSIYIGDRQRIIRFWQPIAKWATTTAYRLVEQWEAYHTDMLPDAYILARETKSGKDVDIVMILPPMVIR